MESASYEAHDEAEGAEAQHEERTPPRLPQPPPGPAPSKLPAWVSAIRAQRQVGADYEDQTAAPSSSSAAVDMPERRIFVSMLEELAPQLAFACLTPEVCQDTPVINSFRHVYGALEDMSGMTCESIAGSAYALVVASEIAAPAATEAVRLFKRACAPTIVLALVATPETGGSMSGPDTRTKAFNRLRECRREAFDAGADEVMCVAGGDTIQPYRLLEAAERAEIWNEKLDTVMTDTRFAMEKQSSALRILEDMLFVHVPRPEPDGRNGTGRLMAEHRGEDGELVGFGELTLGGTLGKGSYGTVYRATLPDGTLCAVKAVEKTRLRNYRSRMNFEKESKCGLYLAPHENVIQALEVMHSKSYFLILMECAGQENLSQHMLRRAGSTGEASLPSDQIHAFAGQMRRAVAHCHGRLICHRDLKPENWLVKPDGATLQLADFGLAEQVIGHGQPLTQSCGTYPFMAPEVVAVSPSYCGLAADLWSLALNFVELLGGPGCAMELLGATATSARPSLQQMHERAMRAPQRWSDFRGRFPDDGLTRAVTGLLQTPAGSRWSLQEVADEELDHAVEEADEEPTKKGPAVEGAHLDAGE